MKSTIQKLRSMISVIAISLILSSFTTSTARVETSFGTTIMGVPSGSKTFTFWGNNYISVSIGNNSSIPVIAFYVYNCKRVKSILFYLLIGIRWELHFMLTFPSMNCLFCGFLNLMPHIMNERVI